MERSPQEGVGHGRRGRPRGARALFRLPLLDTKNGTGAPISYFACNDIEASSATVRELGGTVTEKMPVPTHCWFAECVDSEGNAFRLWQVDTAAG